MKIAPASATGNTVVLKPAETTPLSALFFADICRQAGPPKGVVNILPGYGDAGAALVEHPDVSKVAFTGSTAVGKAIARQVAGTDKKVTLELGGKGANIVFDDAPIDQAVEGVVTGIFFNQGQALAARAPVSSSRSRSTTSCWTRAARSAACSPSASATRTSNEDGIGAINSAEDSCPVSPRLSNRARPRVPMLVPCCELPSSGYWFASMLFTNVTQAHTIARDEIFCLVLLLSTFRTPDEAVAKANNSQYGLSAWSIWTEKGSRILAVASKLRAGVIWSNTFEQVRPDLAVRRLQGVGLRPRGRSPRPEQILTS